MNFAIISRIRARSFEPGQKLLPQVHVLDLAKDGYIKAHVDSVRVSRRLSTKGTLSREGSYCRTMVFLTVKAPRKESLSFVECFLSSPDIFNFIQFS
jgi:hypothetical protein